MYTTTFITTVTDTALSDGLSSRIATGVIMNETLNTTVMTFGQVGRSALHVYWQAKDLSLFDPPYASLLASRLNLSYTASGSMASLSSPTASPGSIIGLPESTASASPASSTASIQPMAAKLGSGVIAGISIGAFLVAIILVTAIFLIYRQRMRKTEGRDFEQEDRATATEVSGVAELQDPRQQANELEVQEKVNELPSPIAELDSNATSKTCRGTEA